jgi:hypothetical protein
MSKVPGLPPTMSVPDAGRVLGLSRNGAYAAAARGDIPVIRIGSKKLVVPTHRLFELLDAPAGARARQEQAPPAPSISSERARRFALALGRATRKAGS